MKTLDPMKGSPASHRHEARIAIDHALDLVSNVKGDTVEQSVQRLRVLAQEVNRWADQIQSEADIINKARGL